MDYPPPLPGTAGSIEHYRFIECSDRRNLHTQLKNLVSLAKDIAAKDLNMRREKLRKLLEKEDEDFEEEFANSAKARLQLEMQERASKKQDESQKVTEFLKKKRIQQCMNSCYEVREALRQKDNEETRIVLEEQMVENERKMARQRELDRYWLRVQQKNLERADAQERNERCMRQIRRDEVNHVLRVQLEEKEAREEEARKEKAAEIERINKLLKELKLEELQRDSDERAQKALKYREELLCAMAEKQRQRQQEDEQLCDEHRQLMAKISKEEEEAASRLRAEKQAEKKKLLEYIDYTQRMRKLEEDTQKMREDRIEDLRRVDVCTKGQRVSKQKAEEAAKNYEYLRRQVCEQYERRKNEEIERREDKIIENRFGRDDPPRAVILEQRLKNRLGLDKQIEEMKRAKGAEDEKYNARLLKAVHDPETCRQLAEEYIRDRVDYLDPHPNWLIQMNPCKEFVAKRAADAKLKGQHDTDAILRSAAREPFLPQLQCTPDWPTEACQKPDKTCEKTEEKPAMTAKDLLCGCEKRWHSSC